MKDTRWNAGWWMRLYLILAPMLVQSVPCPLCSNGPEQIPNRDRLVDPTQGNTLTNTCGFLADSGTSFIQEGTDLCQAIRSAATTCGCNIPPDACLLCWDGSRAPNVDLELVDYPATELIPASPPGALFNCNSLEAALHTMDENDPQCSAIQQDAGERCGCPPFPGSEEGGSNNETSLAPTETAATAPVPEDEAEPLEPCSVCVGGELMPLPDKPLTIGNLPIRTCSDLDSFTALLVGGSDECRGLQLLGPHCGCAKPPNSCSLCPNGEPVPNKNAKINFLADVEAPPEEFGSIGDSFTCEIAESVAASNPGALFGLDESIVCQFLQFRSNLCGCKPDWLQIVLQWAYRLSGMLSVLGSTLIVVNVLKKKKGKRFTTYNQLVLGMSFFDCISSVSYVFSTALAPKDSGLFHAIGNDATCKAQGVMIQLGLTSMFYNMLVSIYFWLVICQNWKEHQFRKIRLWAHVVICGVGAALAFSAIPFIGAQLSVCSLLIPPATPSLLPAILIFTVPLACVVLVLSVATGAICWKVYMQQKKAQKWMATGNMALTKKVFWQSFWYVVAFYVTIPWLLLNYYAEYRSSTQALVRNFFVAIFSPSQGLLNSLVYFQRQHGWTRCRCCGGGSVEKKKKAPTKQATSSATANTSAGTYTGGRSRASNSTSSSSSAAVADVVLSVDGTTQRKTENVGDLEGQQSEKPSNETVEVGQQSLENKSEVDEEEAMQQNDSSIPGEAEFSAVAEYWELNEEDDDSGNVDTRGSLLLGLRRSSLTVLVDG